LIFQKARQAILGLKKGRIILKILGKISFAGVLFTRPAWFPEGVLGKEKMSLLLFNEGWPVKKFHKLLTFS
jgi:hypothetical protein